MKCAILWVLFSCAGIAALLGGSPSRSQALRDGSVEVLVRQLGDRNFRLLRRKLVEGEAVPVEVRRAGRIVRFAVPCPGILPF